jgi:hypothetical protein
MIHNRFVQFMIAMLVLLVVGFSAHAQNNDAYQIALERIEQAASTNVRYLNLSRLDLTQLPPEIGRLTNLHSLYLSYNNLTSLPPEIGQLSNLQLLDLRHNNLTSLPPEIGQLANLEELYLSYNDLTSLPPEIGQLSNLQILDLRSNDLTSLPSEMSQLTQVNRLLLTGNNLPPMSDDVRSSDIHAQIDYLINPTVYRAKQAVIVLIVGLILAGVWFKFEWSHKYIIVILCFGLSVLFFIFNYRMALQRMGIEQATSTYSVQLILTVIVVPLILAGLWHKFEWLRTYIEYIIGVIIGGVGGGIGVFLPFANAQPEDWMVIPFFIAGGALVGIIMGLVCTKLFRTIRQNRQSRKIKDWRHVNRS